MPTQSKFRIFAATSERASSFIAIWLVLVFALSGCSNDHTTTTVPPPSTNFIYTADAAGNQSTVSALASDQTTGALTTIAGSPYNTGSGSMAVAADPIRRLCRKWRAPGK